MRRTIIAGIFILTLTSCTKWTTVSIAPATYIRRNDPASVWVQLRDNSTLVLGRPRVIGDTLRGVNAGGYRNIPLSSVVVMRAEEPARKKTSIVIAVSAVCAIGVIYLLAHTDNVSQ